MSLLGASIGGLYGLGTGYNQASTNNTNDLAKYYAGDITKEQLLALRRKRTNDMLGKTLLYSVGGAAAGQGVRKVIDKAGKEVSKQLAEARKQAEEAIRTSSREYEAMSKRVADHSAEEIARKLDQSIDQKLDRLPRWMGGRRGWFGGGFGEVKEASIDPLVWLFFNKEVIGE